jgi:hypothetical protein
MMALTEFVVVTAPFCWATTVLQSDSSTLQDLLDNLPTITTAFQTIKEAAQHFPEAQRERTLYMVALAERSLAARKTKYLDNDCTRVLAVLDLPREITFEQQAFLAGVCSAYFKTATITAAVKNIDAEVRRSRSAPTRNERCRRSRFGRDPENVSKP